MANLPANPGQALWIGDDAGKNHANIGIGQGTSGGVNHTDFEQSDVEDGYTDAAKFFLNSTGNPVFRINASAGTTSTNTKHPRSECREETLNGALAKWDGRSGDHYLRARCRIITVTSNRPWVCFGQIHGSSSSPNTSDLIRLQTEGTNGTSTGLSLIARRTPPGGSEIRTVLRTGYNVGDWFNYEIRQTNGTITVKLDDVVVLTASGMGQIDNYFKYGCYLQDSLGEGAASGDWGAVEFERGSVQVWHTGYPNPTTPVFTGGTDSSGGPGTGTGGADIQPPTSPAGLTVTRGSSGNQLTWNPATDNVGVDHYNVYRSGGTGSGGGAGTGGGGTTGVPSTFGKTDGGAATTSSSADKMAASKFTATSGGTLTGGHARIWLDASGTTEARVLVYADSSGAPGALLATSDEVNVTSTAEGVVDFAFSGAAQITIQAGTAYWLALVWDDPGTPSVVYSRGADSGQRLERGDITYGTFPNPFGTSTGTFSGPIDVWVDLNATGAASGSTTTPTVRASSTAAKSSNSSGSISVAKPSGLAAGDYLLAVSVGDADITPASMTAPSGWALLSSQAGDSSNNYPSVKVFGKAATSSDLSASNFSFGFTSTGDGATILAALTAGTYDTTTPVTVGTFTTQARTSTTTQTAPSMTGVAGALLLDIFGTDTNGTTESYPTNGPSGFTRLATAQGTPHYAMAGVYTKALTAAGATGTASVSPTGAGTTNGWTTHTLLVNPKVTSGGGGGGSVGGGSTTGYTLIASPTTTSYLDTAVATTSGQTRGVGGIPAPAAGPNVVLVGADSSSRLNITTSGKTYDGQGHTVAGITIGTDSAPVNNVTVQNFKIQDATRDGVSIVGSGNTVQNCSIVRVSSDGSDINAITLFGDGHKILYNEAGVSDFMATGTIGGSHTDFVQCWNTSSKRSTSNLLIQGNRVVGPATSDPRYVHQFFQGEGKGSTDGGGGGTGVSSGIQILDNILDFACVNQPLNFLDIDEVDIARNQFNGSGSKRVGTGDGSTGIRYWTSNTGSGSYGSIGVSTTSGTGPAGVSTTTGGEPVVYSYLVTAVDAAGNESGNGGGGTSGGAPDTQAPTVPTNLVATPTAQQIGLRWDASTDDVGVTQYTIRRGGTIVARLLGTPPTTGYVDRDVVAGTSYSYTVSASDAAGNESGQSSATSATAATPTLGGVALLPGRITGGKLEVSIAWGANLAADEATWAWTDITTDVRQAPGISTSLGRNDESSTSNPADLTLVLTNSSGGYSLGTASSNYPNVRRNTPVRVRIDPGDGKGGRTAFLGFANGWSPGWDSLKGTVPVVTLSASGTLRRLAQGDAPVTSAYRRVMTALPSVVAYWPMEEGKNADYAPAVRGGSNFTFTGGEPGWASSDDFDCSAPLPTIGNAYWQADVNSYTDTGASQLRMLLSVPDSGFDDGVVLMHITMTGSIIRWDLTYNSGNGSPSLGLVRYNADSSKNSSDQISFPVLGKPGRLSFDTAQSGSNIVWTLGFTPAVPGASANFFRGTIAGKTCGRVSHIEINPHNANLGAGIGHLTVENAITSYFTDNDALIAHAGDYATPVTGGRLSRLCAENKVPFVQYGNGATLGAIDQMGPQLVAPLLDLLHEAETADQGQLWDGRSAGLQYTTRRRRASAAGRLTVNASLGRLTDDFKPVDDDQRNRNRATVTRLHGTTVTYEDVSGPLGTAAIGIYDDSITVNTYRDQYVAQYARWFVLLGTVAGYRYPTVTIDLNAAPSFAAPVLDVIPGDRIDISNLNTTLAGFADASISLIVEGIAHEITTRAWQVTFRCSPYAPWATGLDGA